MSKRFANTIKTVVLLAAVAGIAYFGHLEYQSHLGRQAIKSTGLEILDLDAALAKSAISGKPVLADLSAIWCPSCHRLDKEVLGDTAVRSKINADYVYARVEYDSPQGREFMQRYQLSGFPSLIVLDSKGVKIKQLPLSFSPATFIKAL